ncbi:hypothetical protein JRQ81_006561 [Phrynocephalus forsythii]|uniref:Peptide deformylase n=1 Tax=Phrynocephalus forsythii TaxID=171643 RepID=A0A9Q1AUQ8_9SAUR|nr:hypothetical protein JRQ81_006561 [Phrynocephalus forsythii]
MACQLRPALGWVLTHTCRRQALLAPKACKPGVRAVSSNLEKKRSYWQHLRRMILKPPTPPYKHVCQVGDPILRCQAAPVEPAQIASQEVQAVLVTLVRVMRREKCVALSAPQLGVPLQIFVTEYPEKLCYEHPPSIREIQQIHPFPLRVFVNPTMKVLSSHLATFPEGCRSVGDFSACVPRYQAVEVSGLNEAGEETSWQASGWAARVIQHEMDHLQGVLFIDKMDSQTFTSIRWATVHE